MLVVLDSNIFISALISPHGCPHKIYQAWLSSQFKIVTCQEQLDELRRASRYPKLRAIIQPHLFGYLLNRMEDVCDIQEIRHLHHTDDPDDAYLLDLADSAGANYLVTGDRQSGLLKKRRVGHASILTASAFCAKVL
jgi:uncharacterized protein